MDARPRFLVVAAFVAMVLVASACSTSTSAPNSSSSDTTSPSSGSSVQAATPMPPAPFESARLVARGEAAGSRWLLVDSGAGLWLIGEDGTEFAMDTDAPTPYLCFASYSFRDNGVTVTVAFGTASREVESVALVSAQGDTSEAVLESIPGGAGLQTYWIAFEDENKPARIVGYGAGSDPLQTWLVHDPASIERIFGEVVAIRNGFFPPTIRLHRAEVFFNEDAQRAALEDGVIVEGEELPNPFYVRDLGRTQTLSVSRDAIITLLAYDEHGSPTVKVSMELPEFQSAFEAGLRPPEWYGGPWYRVTLEEGVVMRMRALYTP